MRTTTRKTREVIGLESAGTLMTAEEFDAAEDWDENYNYELVHGVLVVMAPPLEAERDPNEELGYLLRSYRDHHPEGTALDKTLPEQYVRTADSRRRADRIIWAGLGRLPKTRLDPPTIAIEFVSRGKRNRRRDYEENRDEYKDIGVAEYWIIDRFQRIMTVFRNRPGKPATLVIKETQIYRTPLLPGFELPLARLLVLADIWEKPK